MGVWWERLKAAWSRAAQWRNGHWRHARWRHARWRRLAVRGLRLLAACAAVLYVLLDVVMLLLVRPLVRRLAAWPGFLRVGVWVDRLGPRTTLALLLLPLALLEPAKPMGAWLVAEGHTVSGILLIVVAEVVKLATVERLYQRSRGKLLTIGWFARLHAWGTGWLERLRATAPWRAARAVSAALVRTLGWATRHPSSATDHRR